MAITSSWIFHGLQMLSLQIGRVHIDFSVGFSMVFPHVPGGNAAPRLLSLDQGAQGAAVQAGLSLRVPAPENPRKSEEIRGKTWENHGKPVENLWKIWEIYGKSWETIWDNLEKSWENDRKMIGKYRKIMRKP